jgi:hypothetical protein
MSFDNVSIYRDIDASQTDSFAELLLTAVLSLMIDLVFSSGICTLAPSMHA